MKLQLIVMERPFKKWRRIQSKRFEINDVSMRDLNKGKIVMLVDSVTEKHRFIKLINADELWSAANKRELNQ